ncbi:MAG: HupE/UreJ family protein [bacterium]
MNSVHIRSKINRDIFLLARLPGMVILSIFIVVFSDQAGAHEVRPAIVNLNLMTSGYELEIKMNLEAIMAGIEPQHSDTGESANADEYDRLRKLSRSDLESLFVRRQSNFIEGINVKDAKGNEIRHRLGGITVPETGDLDFPRVSQVRLIPEFDRKVESVTWGWISRFGPSVIRVNQIVDNAQRDGYSAFLGAAQRSAEIPLSGSVASSISQVIWNYLVIGFTHILPKGLDHILFVIGLFLLSPRLKPLLVQVTSFTVAHTITLALGSLELIQISTAIVEPLIAASIIYVAVENIFSDRLNVWRTFIVFGFGLLHGLGFASVLSEIGIDSDRFLSALIAFNLGVEFGQLAVILGCFLLVGLWFRHRAWYRRVITVPGSVVIATVGAIWFVQRTIG